MHHVLGGVPVQDLRDALLSRHGYTLGAGRQMVDKVALRLQLCLRVFGDIAIDYIEGSGDLRLEGDDALTSVGEE